MKDAAKILVKHPAAFIIAMLILLLVLLFSVRAAQGSDNFPGQEVSQSNITIEQTK